MDRDLRSAALADVFAPANDFEQALVERMAAAFQRLEKADQLEDQAFASTLTIRPQSDGSKLVNNTRCRQSFDVLNRYRATAAGELFNTVRLLEALRQARRAAETPPLRNEPKRPGA